MIGETHHVFCCLHVCNGSFQLAISGYTAGYSRGVLTHSLCVAYVCTSVVHVTCTLQCSVCSHGERTYIKQPTSKDHCVRHRDGKSGNTAGTVQSVPACVLLVLCTYVCELIYV